MRKVNRMLMKIASVLLCLVLITSCVVSGTLAKYVHQKKIILNNMTFEKFGVEVEISVPIKESLEKNGVEITYPAEGSSDVKSGIYEITIDKLSVGPGDDYRHLVRFDFSGNANVPVNVEVSTVVEYDTNNWYIPTSSEIYTKDYYCLPLGFHCYAYNGNTAVKNFSLGDPWRRAETADGAASADNRSKNISKNLWKNVDFAGDEAPSNKTTLSKEFFPNVDDGLIAFYSRDEIEKDVYEIDKSKKINALEMGFWWPFEDEGNNESVAADKINKVSTYIARNNQNATIKITYTVRVTQTKST